MGIYLPYIRPIYRLCKGISIWLCYSTSSLGSWNFHEYMFFPIEIALGITTSGNTILSNKPNYDIANYNIYIYNIPWNWRSHDFPIMLPFMLSKNPKIKQLANSYKKRYGQASAKPTNQREFTFSIRSSSVGIQQVGWKTCLEKMVVVWGCSKTCLNKFNAISSYQDDSNPLLNGKIRDALWMIGFTTWKSSH